MNEMKYSVSSILLNEYCIAFTLDRLRDKQA